MAVFATDKPFGNGVRQMKYEKMLSECPERVREMPREDLEEYLGIIERTYVKRCGELYESCMRSLGVTSDLATRDYGLWYERYEQATAQAREIALNEAMAA